MTEGINTVIDENGVATLTINRRNKLNAFNESMVLAFNAEMEKLNSQRELRAVVMQAAGKIFCAGADLTYLCHKGEESWEKNLTDAKAYAEMTNWLRVLRVPVIAKVQGGAFGGGVGFIAASDIVITENKATFAITEGKYGFTASIIMPYLLPRIGTRQARRWCLTSEIIPAQTANTIGLVDMVVEDGYLEVSTNKLVDGLLDNGPKSLTETKLAVNYLNNLAYNCSARELSIISFAKGRAMKSAVEGVSSFFQKRNPYWMSEFTGQMTEEI